MKSTIKTIPFLISLTLVMLISSSSFASVTCKKANVVRVGVVPQTSIPARSDYIIRATCSEPFALYEGGERQFYLTPEVGDAGLATILTAISLGQQILLKTGAATNGSLVETIYLSAPATP